MKGVILAGGSGTRLMPLTKTINKHMLSVYNNPMLHYPIATLIEAGIKDILIVSGREHIGDIVEYFGSGKDYNARFSYEIQEEAGGIAQALGLAEEFVGENKMVVALGDNLFQNNFVSDVKEFEKSGKDNAKVFLVKVEDPKPYGVAALENQKLIAIEEKPDKPKSDLIVTGIYFYNSDVFKVVKKLKPSGRGELEISDVNNHYIEQRTMTYRILTGWWGDAGEDHDSYLRACNLAAVGDIQHLKRRGRPRKNYLDQ